MNGGVLDDHETTDVYTEVMAYGSTVLTLDVFTAGIYYELGTATGGTLQWDQAPKPLPPGFRSMDVAFDAVRVKSRAPGVVAFVDLVAR